MRLAKDHFEARQVFHYRLVQALSPGDDDAHQQAGHAHARLVAVILRSLQDDPRQRCQGLICRDLSAPDQLSVSDTYFVSTDNGQGLLDEVHDDMLCPGGPAIDGGCDPTQGTPILVIAAESVVIGIDFEFRPTIFADGFESGDTAASDATVGH